MFWKTYFIFLFSLFYLLSSFCMCYGKGQNTSLPLLNYEVGVRLHRQGDLKGAVVYLNNALTLSPTHFPSLVELGIVLTGLAKPDLAIPIFIRALNLAQDDAFIHVLLASAYEKNKQINEALSHYKLACGLEEENTLLKLNVGLQCLHLEDYNCAKENLEKVIFVYPNELRAQTALGDVYYAMKDYDLARKQYQKVLEVESDNPFLWYNLANVQFLLAKYEDALLSINKALLNYKSEVPAQLYLDRARINYKLGKLNETENDYLGALKLEPVNPSCPAEYGIFLWKNNSFLKAAEQFAHAYELEPDNQSLLINEAYLLQLGKSNSQAKTLWESILAKDSSNPVVLFNLGKLYQEEENYKGAIEKYKILLGIKQDDSEAKSALAYCLHKIKSYDEARSVYESILSSNSGDISTLYNVGLLLNEQKKFKEAADYLEKVVKSDFPQKANAYSLLSGAYTSLNDTENLKRIYKEWLNLDKNNFQIRVSYAKFLAMTGSLSEATDEFRVASALDSTMKTKYDLAQFLLEQKDLYGAVGQLQEYLKSYPNDLNALILLANAFKDLGIKEQAINTYKKIISVQADNYLAHYNLGLLYSQDKQYEQAINYLLKSIELDESYAPAYYALAISYLSGDSIGKAKEYFEKYLKIAPNGEYREIVQDKLKELMSKPGINENSPA